MRRVENVSVEMEGKLWPGKMAGPVGTQKTSLRAMATEC